ncbi:hypothetical protein [Streptomyces sp. B6B3]|uniref:hypothetical protein n=1 Tax=Streptomyces sp. B6B3 TaxID=3153570 RepID=UPI00325D726B
MGISGDTSGFVTLVLAAVVLVSFALSLRADRRNRRGGDHPGGDGGSYSGGGGWGGDSGGGGGGDGGGC